LIHIVLGISIYLFPFIAKIYAVLIILVGVYFVVKNKNKNHEVLYVSAYIVGSEVLLRMTNGFLNYEAAKYSVISFAVLGMFYSGISKKAVMYWVYLLLLIPSVILTYDFTDITRDALRTIAFGISGPICLGLIAIYAYDKKITSRELNNILFTIGLPILSTGIYVFFYSPKVSSITSVESSGAFSGGFGPNQVATSLGIGLFVFFAQFVMRSKSKLFLITYLLISAFLLYIGLLTFSRGGILTGVGVVLAFLALLYFHSGEYGKLKSKQSLLYFICCVFSVGMLVSYQTGGLIEKRYSNRDHLGRTKRDKITDRRELAKEELNLFIKNPILGIGVGEGDKEREKEIGQKFASHDEITRMLAEHGSLGLLGLLILIATPVWLFFNNKQNIFLVPFFLFWFLTINHSGMRIAAPAFIYALMLLNVSLNDPFFCKQFTAEEVDHK
jgi:hypothetical protein